MPGRTGSVIGGNGPGPSGSTTVVRGPGDVDVVVGLVEPVVGLTLVDSGVVVSVVVVGVVVVVEGVVVGGATLVRGTHV